MTEAEKEVFIESQKRDLFSLALLHAFGCGNFQPAQDFINQPSTDAGRDLLRAIGPAILHKDRPVGELPDGSNICGVNLDVMAVEIEEEYKNYTRERNLVEKKERL